MTAFPNPAATGPDPDQPHPIAQHPRVCFLKSCIQSPLISVGEYTYYDDPIAPEEFERNVLYHFGPDRLIIGKFCAIATQVKFIMGGAYHKLDGISTYPFPIFGQGWDTAMDLLLDLPAKPDTVIGNDVWIGYESTIMAGVTVGDGAVIAAKSVVVKDVPPYTIVGGNPAKVIRQRFDDATIAELLSLRWWDWPIEVITQQVRAIMSGDLNALRKAAPSYINPS